ncbi:hypothetical protein [Streptomyces herbicida]|uniref:hypothetical protein n=1 Tax=Streptomyces herbicida TaxID=3065675 RepID=UPI00292E0D1D|nr:hypothetical protein [Streptomyces sp. NEAU-HV9]
MWQQDIGVFPARFRDQGDEFAHHVSAEFGDPRFMTAQGSNGNSPVELGPPLSGMVSSRLVIRSHEGGVACTVVGDSDSASAQEVEPWRRAVHAAAEALGRRDRVFVWEAVVSTYPRQFGLDRTGILAGPRSLGPVALAPGGVMMREYVPTPDRVDQGPGVRHTFPLLASGAVTCYAWEPVESAAHRCLRRACALLSLATGSLWIPRTYPTRRTEDSEGLRVPAVVGASRNSHLDDAGGDGEVPADAETFELPGWTAGAWQLLDTDRELDTAVGAHYEALSLEAHRHPSLAHLAFVAAIEGFGMRLVPDAPCRCHSECTHPKGVAQARFRKALKTVMTQKEIKQLASDAYPLRSFTGHRGTLFGSEHTFGYWPTSLFKPGDDSVFDLHVVGELRHASRRVLTKALSTGLPSADAQ